MYQNQGQLRLPQAGQRIAFSSQGKYIGKTKEKFQQIGIAPKLDSYEVFIVETDGTQYAFRQQVSNMYLGGEINEGKTPMWADKRDVWEQHFLELYDNGHFRIRSVKNTYLCISGNKLIWKSNPDVYQSLWDSTLLSGSAENAQTSILPLGLPVYLYNNYGIIGKKRGIREALEMVKEVGDWEQFMPVKSKNSNKIGLKQVVSGYHMGHHANENEPVCLTPCFLGNQQFVVEDRGNKKISIKNINNLYLSVKQDGKKVIWKRNLDNAGIWQFQIQHQKQNFPIFPKGTVTITQAVHT